VNGPRRQPGRPSQSRSMTAATKATFWRRRHSLTGPSWMHAAWDVFVILEAGRLWVARYERALPLIIDLCPDKWADNRRNECRFMRAPPAQAHN
jgi:hypothetical protein